jgi:SAM-dependent methyltransferase
MNIDMRPDDLKTICHYQSLLHKHGESYRSLDWGSRESQIKRFEILAGIGVGPGDRVLDVGCGFADFNTWLIEHRPGVEYSGVDLTPGMVEKAQARFPNATILNKTIFDLDLAIASFDYLVASGIFYLRNENPMQYMESTIAQMFNFANKGIAFNSLSAWSKDKIDGEFFAEPADVMIFCKKLSHYVVLRHDYHPSDFTVYVYRSLPS